jgi:hypothetical protein
MARRRISLWVEEETYADYKRLAVALRQTTADTLRAALESGLPSSEELRRDLGLPDDLLRANDGDKRRAGVQGWRRFLVWARG